MINVFPDKLTHGQEMLRMTVQVGCRSPPNRNVEADLRFQNF